MLHTINDLIQNVYKSKIIQQKAELKALQAQIKPHFLYNTLQAVNWNAISRNDTETSRIVVNLSNFYRSILNKGEDEITVEDEINIVRYYVNIQQEIYKQAFTVTYELDESLFHYRVPYLILQPLVENAIEHGIRKSHQPSGTITITAAREDKCMRFSVADNGAGIAPEKRGDILKFTSQGYGIKNIHDRIQARYGQKYGLSVTSYDNPTVFTIILPLTESDIEAH